MISLFAGGLTFFGYLAALIIGGDTATAICSFIYEKIIPVIIYLSTSMVILGLLAMYLNGETALTSDKKKHLNIKVKCNTQKTPSVALYYRGSFYIMREACRYLQHRADHRT